MRAHCFTDGHDKLRVVLGWQAVGDGRTDETDMTLEVNDVWVRSASALALVKISGPQAGRAIPVLIEGLTDESEDTRDARRGNH